MTFQRELTLATGGPDDRPGCRVGVLCLHTSPLEQPGAGDSGGMNVYVREVAEHMARRRIYTDIYTRRTRPDEPAVSEPVPGVRVFAISAGPPRPVHKDRLPTLVKKFADGVAEVVKPHPPDVLHAHYWLSAVAGAQLKETLGVPLVTSFHTLARVKDLASVGGEPEPLFRKRGEDCAVKASDRLVAPTTAERTELIELYGADPARIDVVAPGVDLDVFRPGDRAAARRRFGIGNEPTVLFVGRLQPLKGPHVAVGALAKLKRLVPDARLILVGGDSPRGMRGELRRLSVIARRAGVARRIRFIDPLPAAELADLYRAADAVVVPSASESFGLVALEAAACGTPAVASAVGGLRILVRDGETGYLVGKREPAQFAHALSRILADPATRDRLGAAAVRLAHEYPWSRTVHGLLGSYESVMACPGIRAALMAAGL